MIMTRWTPENFEVLKQAIKDGWTGSMAAEKLNISRSAAIGKAYRHDLKFCGNNAARVMRIGDNGVSLKKVTTSVTSASQSAQPIKQDASPLLPSEILEEQGLAASTSVVLVDVTPDGCQWPVGNNELGEHLFCNKKVEAPSQPRWCEEHREKGFSKVAQEDLA